MRNIVIVGAGPGIGMAVARKFAEEGYSVGLISRNRDKLEGLVAELAARGHRAKCYTADAGDEVNLRAALATAEAELGAPEVLVYNCAVLKKLNLTAVQPEDLVAEFRVNTVGALVAVQALLPAMRAAGKGTILFTGGGLATNPFYQYGSLSVGKAGIRSLAFSLAQELKTANIHVATVTVAGLVQPNTPFDPDKIAPHFWRLHTQPRESWEVEYVFKGEKGQA